MSDNEVREGLASQERGVASEHNDRLRRKFNSIFGQPGERTTNGMAGSVLFVLHRGVDAWKVASEVCRDLLTLVPDDNNNVLRICLEHRCKHVAKDRSPKDRVQDLREARLHAGALASG